MIKGLVSIIIPSYNGSDKVSKAVRSVLNQTYKDVEAIVVDDNGVGTEEQIKTEKALAQFKEYPNFRYITHEVNKNGSAARNTGAKAANGEYLGFLDDDDEYLPEFAQLHIDEHNTFGDEYALTYCSCQQWRNGELVEEKIKTESGALLYEVLTHRVIIGSTSLIIKKSAFDEIGGFDESFRRHQDWEFTARVAAKYKVKAIEKVGFKRNLEYRNSPKNYETAKKYRIHYVEKMMPYIKTLDKKKQKDVITKNYVNLLLPLLSSGKIFKFIKEFMYFKLGFRGFVMLMKDLHSYVFVSKTFWTREKRK